jgi:aminoglycoside phosphotransferase (APT) family kinase protein
MRGDGRLATVRGLPLSSPVSRAQVSGAGAMPLSESEVIDHLVAADVLCIDDVVDTGLTIETSSRRNRNFRITWPDGGGYFVKLPNERSPMSRSTLRSEAEFYRATADHPFETFLARLTHADVDTPLLVLELETGHDSLREVVAAARPGEFPIALHRRIGRLLGAVHATDPGSLGAPASPPSVTPVADYGRPDPWLLSTATGGTLMLMEMLQDSAALSSGLTDLVDQWQAETLVHGDIRADNVLVGGSAADDLRLVDWELWHAGDSAQDLAGLLEVIVSATIGRALADSPPYADDAATWGIDLDTAGTILQATCHAVWRAYISTRGLTSPVCRALAPRVAAYTAARIVQSEVEVAEHGTAVSDRGCAMLQLAENLFTDPERAAAEFLGLT